MSNKKSLIEKQRTILLRELRKWEQKSDNVHILFHVSVSQLPDEMWAFYDGVVALKFGKVVLSLRTGEGSGDKELGTGLVREFIEDLTEHMTAMLNNKEYTDEELVNTVTLELLNINKTPYDQLPGLDDIFDDAIRNVVYELEEGGNKCTQ